VAGVLAIGKINTFLLFGNGLCCDKLSDELLYRIGENLSVS